MKRIWRFRIAAITFGILLTLIGVEIALRVNYYRAMGSGLASLHTRVPSNPNQNLWLRDILLPAEEPDLWYVPKPHVIGTFFGSLIRLNEIGLRERDRISVDPKPPGVTRVLAVGDSVTFGWGVAAHETYPVWLMQGLNACSPLNEMYEVINFGVPTFTARQEYLFFLKHCDALKPDVILWQYELNDTLPPSFMLHTNAPIPKDPFLLRVLRGGRTGLLPYDLAASIDASLIQKEDPGPFYIDPKHVPEEFRPHVGWNALVEAYRGMSAWCRERNIPLIVILPAHEVHRSHPDRHFDPDYDKIKTLCAELKIPVIDTYPLMLEIAKRENLKSSDLAVRFPFDLHPNARRHKIMAQAILDRLPEILPSLSERADCISSAID